MENNEKKTEYITRKDLEEQTQILLEAIDKRMGSMEKNLNANMDHRFNDVNDQFVSMTGRMSSLEKHIDEVRDDLRIDINNVQTLIDGYVKAQEDFKQEFEIMKKEHDLMKRIIREKLGLEIKIA